MAKFCVNCGSQMEDHHKVCGSCGIPDQTMNAQFNSMQRQPEMNNQQYYHGMDNNQVTDEVQIGWVVLSFFVPIAGWILCGQWNNTKPKTARFCGIAGTIGFILNLFLLF